MIDKVKEIEEKFNVKEIKYKNFEVWNFIRAIIFHSYYTDYSNINNKNIINTKKKLIKTILIYLKSSLLLFYSLLNIIKKINSVYYIILSNYGDRRKINNKLVNRLTYKIQLIFKNKYIIFENYQNINNLNLNKINNKSEIFPLSIIDLLVIMISKIIYFFYNKHMIIFNENELLKIIKELNINIDYKKIIIKFCVYYFFYDKVIFKILKPKVVFISCYYTLNNQATILAAKKRKIIIIEFQHGIINDKHFAYNIFFKLNKNYFPDYLFVFGKYFKKFFNDNYFINYNNVFEIGSFYLEYIRDHLVFNKNKIKKINKIRKKYSKIVAITSQNTIEEELIKFIKKVSIIMKNVYFIFIPRNYLYQDIKYNFFENLRIYNDLNFYEIMKFSDIHCTVYSTTALESLFFGVPNILININNLSNIYYKDILNNKGNTIIVNTIDEFINTLKTYKFDSKENIKKNNIFFENNYDYNLKMTLKKIGINY